MKEAILAALALCVAFVPACSTIPGTDISINTEASPSEQLARIDATFTKTVQTINSLHDSGQITDDQLKRLEPFVKKGDAALDAAWKALEASNEDKLADKIEDVRDVLKKLKPIVQEAK